MRQWTLSQMLVVVVVVSVVASAGAPIVHRIYRRSLHRTCGAHLQQLVKCMYHYNVTGMGDAFPDDTGSRFWTGAWQRRQLEDPGVLWCPVRGEGIVGQIHYRGPGRDPNAVQVPLPFWGCDRPDNHAPGEPLNAVRMSGDVVAVVPGTPEHARALSETRP